MVINSKDKITKPQQSSTYDNDKENESKFSKFETDVKSYESLVLELKKLSAEELNIRNKLFPYNLKVYFN